LLNLFVELGASVDYVMKLLVDLCKFIDGLGQFFPCVGWIGRISDCSERNKGSSEWFEEAIVGYELHEALINLNINQMCQIYFANGAT
jgi:hypothetical protein